MAMLVVYCIISRSIIMAAARDGDVGCTLNNKSEHHNDSSADLMFVFSVDNMYLNSK